MQMRGRASFTAAFTPRRQRSPPLRRCAVNRHTSKMTSASKVGPQKGSLRSYLQSAKPPYNRPIHIILGNEACDVDSLMCALVLGYGWRNRGALPTVPVANIPRIEVELRRDVLLALEFGDVRKEDVVFVDEMPGGVEGAAVDGIVTLVDHNEVGIHQMGVAGAVDGVVDHHADAGLFKGASVRVVDGVGSCATLVAETLGRGCIDEVMGRLLLCAILVDTGNLQNRKTDGRDVEVVRWLRGVAGWDEGECGRVTGMLKRARRDVSGFSGGMLLRKDFKRFKGGRFVAGVSSMGGVEPRGFERVCEEEDGGDVAGCLERLGKEKGVDCVVGMFIWDGREGTRRVLGVLKGEVGDGLARKLGDGIGGVETREMMMMQEDGVHAEDVHWLEVVDAGLSRKVIGPAIADILNQLSG